MIPFQRVGAMVAVAIILSAVPVLAAPLDTRQVSAHAKYLIYLDVDAAVKTHLWHNLKPSVLGNPRVHKALAKFRQITGAHLPENLHDVLIYGTGFSPQSPVVIMHADTNRERVLRLLRKNAAYSQADYGTYKVQSWVDKGRQMYGSYYNAKTIIIGHSEKVVEQALDVLDGKAAALASHSNLLGGLAPGDILYVTGTQLWKLPKVGAAHSALLRMISHAWVRVSEGKNSLNVQARVATKTAHTAKQMRRSLVGLRALVELSLGGPHPSPKAAALAQWTRTASITSEGRHLQIQWPIPLTMIQNAVQRKLAAGSSYQPDGQ